MKLPHSPRVGIQRVPPAGACSPRRLLRGQPHCEFFPVTLLFSPLMPRYMRAPFSLLCFIRQQSNEVNGHKLEWTYPKFWKPTLSSKSVSFILFVFLSPIFTYEIHAQWISPCSSNNVWFSCHCFISTCTQALPFLFDPVCLTVLGTWGSNPGLVFSRQALYHSTVSPTFMCYFKVLDTTILHSDQRTKTSFNPATAPISILRK